LIVYNIWEKEYCS